MAVAPAPVLSLSPRPSSPTQKLAPLRDIPTASRFDNRIVIRVVRDQNLIVVKNGYHIKKFLRELGAQWVRIVADNDYHKLIPPKSWMVSVKATETPSSVAKSIYSACKAGGDDPSNGPPTVKSFIVSSYSIWTT